MTIPLKSKVLAAAAIATAAAAGAAGTFAFMRTKKSKKRSENGLSAYPHTAGGESADMTTPHTETATAIDPSAQPNTPG